MIINKSTLTEILVVVVKKDFFVKKKILLGLTLVGEGLITPPPQKIVGLKLCWVVVSIVKTPT